MKEADLYKILVKKAINTMFVRIENKLNLGTPDIYFVNKNCCGWLEAKKLTLGEKYEGIVKIPFRPYQFEWLEKNYKHGGMSVLGIISDWGIYFAINEAIKLEYNRSDFRNGKLICPNNYDLFFSILNTI